MRIALVATYTHPIALGLRYLSSYLKAHHQQVEMYFMRSKRDTAEADFSPVLSATTFCTFMREFSPLA